MDSCWKNTPEEILQIILRFACSRLVYRDGCYIEIGKVKNDFDSIQKFTIRNLDIRQNMCKKNTLGQFYFEYLQFKFDKSFKDDQEQDIFHGLYYDFNSETPNTFEIGYWSSRDTN